MNEDIRQLGDKFDQFAAELSWQLNQLGRLVADLHESAHREMHEGFARLEKTMDTQQARIDRNGGMLQAGSKWVNRLNQSSENVDRLLASQGEHMRKLEERIKKLENGNQ
jgi:hypothetical protein